MSESTLSRLIQVELTSVDVRLWRFPVGEFKLADDRGYITVGVPGMSDLLGCVSQTITPAMLGQRIAQLVAVEVKVPGARTHPKRLADQRAFIEQVSRLGGRAGFATSVAGAAAILRSIPTLRPY